MAETSGFTDDGRPRRRTPIERLARYLAPRLRLWRRLTIGQKLYTVMCLIAGLSVPAFVVAAVVGFIVMYRG